MAGCIVRETWPHGVSLLVFCVALGVAMVLRSSRGRVAGATSSGEPAHRRRGARSRSGAVRAQGAWEQNVNKVSSAVHLRFDVAASSLPDAVKERLLGAQRPAHERRRRHRHQGAAPSQPGAQSTRRARAPERAGRACRRAAAPAQADAADGRRRASAGSKARVPARRSRQGAQRSSSDAHPGQRRVGRSSSGAFERREKHAEGDEEAAEDALHRAPARRHPVRGSSSRAASAA